MATKFLRQANNFNLVDESALNVHDKLPGGNYVIKVTMEGAMYLQRVEPFVQPSKLYGDINKQAARIHRTFMSRPTGTGVLLSGEKGSGKTLLARTVCVNAAIEGIPTIIINTPFHGENFYSFLSAITQPCIVMFDEFEKIYDVKKNEQDHILTLLDGVFPSKKLFLLTCNDRHGINNNMINRPGRVFYTKEFHGLEENFIREYSLDNLIDKEQVNAIVRVTSMFSEFNFDMLKALIEEMNRYNESPGDALLMLNVSPVYDFATYKTNILLGNGEPVINKHTSPAEIRNPLGQKNGITIRVFSEAAEGSTDADEDGHHQHHVVFFPADVISADFDKMVLRNKDGDVLNLVRERFDGYSWKSFVTTSSMD